MGGGGGGGEISDTRAKTNVCFINSDAILNRDALWLFWVKSRSSKDKDMSISPALSRALENFMFFKTLLCRHKLNFVKHLLTVIAADLNRQRTGFFFMTDISPCFFIMRIVQTFRNVCYVWIVLLA